MKFMKHGVRILALLTLAFFLTKTVTAQGIDSMMGVYAEQYPQQKVYVHFDKSVYRPGETVWFKAYLFDGFEPSNFSRNFYAELIDKSGQVLQRKIYQMVEASAAGNFEIPPAQNGNLSFRAYTSWMLNFDTAFLYKKDITVTDAQGNLNPSKIQSNQTLVSFFPESGDMVADLESVIAFKANDATGKPVNVKGEIKNAKGETMVQFTTSHNGMGTCMLTPVANEKYTAQGTDEFGKEFKVSLPEVKSSGIVLQMTSSRTRKVFVIKRSPNLQGDLTMVNLVAHMAQQIVYKAKVPLSETNLNSGAIPTEQLPTGVLQVTVFNNKWEPLAERIIFVNNDNYNATAKLETPITDVNKRGKNVYEVSVGDTLLTNMSVAITDAEIGTKANEDNIISGLLLSGDLKGYIYDPASYFKNNNDTTQNNIDLLMLTHGWRRYNWQNIAKGRKPFLKQPNDPPLSLIAKVFGVNPSSPIRSDEAMTVILQTKDSSTQILQVPKTGPTEFALRNIVFYDTLKVFYQFEKDKALAGNTSLLFENGLYKGPRIVALTELPPAKIDSIALNRAKYFATQYSRFGDGSKVNILQEVIVKTKPRNPKAELDQRYARGLFAGGDAITFDFVTDKSNALYQDIFTYLQGRVAGLQISTSGGNTSLVWRGSATTTFLNEMQVDAQTLSTIPVTDIAYVKVFRPPFFGATGGGAGGAIAIYTKKGGDQPVEPGKGLNRSLLAGYSIMKQFYSPNYSDAQQDVATDLRSTLYWDPFVFTDARQQKVRIEFYNNDFSKAIRVVIEGVNEIGKIVRIEKVIQ